MRTRVLTRQLRLCYREAMRWWYVARVKHSISQYARGATILRGQMLGDDFFMAGDEVWLQQIPDTTDWLCVQPIPGGRVMRMKHEILPSFLEPRQPDVV